MLDEEGMRERDDGFLQQKRRKEYTARERQREIEGIKGERKKRRERNEI